MTWGKEWPNIEPTILGIDWAKPGSDKTVTIAGKIDDTGKIHIEKVYQNKVPTHDPYTNPNAHIYYQCNCGAILDPGTKSFAALNNAAMVSGWKIRFGHEYYVPYCVKCGEGVE